MYKMDCLHMKYSVYLVYTKKFFEIGLFFRIRMISAVDRPLFRANACVFGYFKDMIWVKCEKK